MDIIRDVVRSILPFTAASLLVGGMLLIVVGTTGEIIDPRAGILIVMLGVQNLIAGLLFGLPVLWEK